MMSGDTPYLILHKVRGLPAFDIAIQMIVEDHDDPWWIIPTSGHRAYPAKAWAINELYIDANGCKDDMVWLEGFAQCIPIDEVPDHYPNKSSPTEDQSFGKALLTKLGLLKPKLPVRRI